MPHERSTLWRPSADPDREVRRAFLRRLVANGPYIVGVILISVLVYRRTEANGAATWLFSAGRFTGMLHVVDDTPRVENVLLALLLLAGIAAIVLVATATPLCGPR
ncbi:MAG TPA: hypothetical protein VKU61_04285 [Candidatus Binatia bacterium]|nr:hypothetical protein [Candidatus Binatia bacterium]